MNEERMRIGGGLVIVSPCSATNRAALQTALEQYGLEELMPEPTTPKAALRAAMTELFPSPEKDVKHRCDPYANGREGYKIGAHKPGEAVHVGDEYTTVVAIGTLDDDNELHLDPYDYDKFSEVKAYMRHVIEYVPAGTLAKTVAAIIEKLGGHILVANKPAYWLNSVHLDRFKRMAAVIEAASAEKDKHGNAQDPTRIDVFSVIADDHMLRAVTAMVTAMINSEVEQIEEEISAPDMTAQRCENRIVKAGRLLERVKEYEKALAEPLTALSANVQRAAVAAATASLQASACGGVVSAL